MSLHKKFTHNVFNKLMKQKIGCFDVFVISSQKY